MAEESPSTLSLTDSEADEDNIGFVDDWQSGKDFIQTNLMMLDGETLSDVTFLVGEEGETILAHRFMLASRSCVFFAMFCGRIAETKEVKITDIQPNVFRQFLRYLYTGVISLSADNALNLLYCSKKYCIKSLEQEVLEYCQCSISPDNACTLLEQACLFDVKQLQEKAFNVMKRDAIFVLTSDSFVDLSHHNLDKLLAMDDLKAEEDVIFKAVVGWAKAECKRQGKNHSAGEMREVLGATLYKVRFPLMAQSVFVELVADGILTDSEKVKILERYISPKSNIEPFIAKPRDTAQVIYRVQRLVQGGFGHPLSKVKDALYIFCDKPVIFMGVMLYAPANIITSALSYFKSFLDPHNAVLGDTVKYYVTLVVRDAQNARVGSHYFDVDLKAGDEQLEVAMTTPVPLTPGERYTLTLVIEGPVRGWGGMNGMSELTDPGGEVTWRFEHVPTPGNTENSLKEGIISGIMYCLVRET
ncbi:BTB/POZ domain-containing protein 3-like isoform X1 [Haliotis cracherodii]|uniref:BTB/POZ domain-containing protein 3-like isoform X1 n=1 Tax=Haliotis cracherodii TaxID=6455 RepID=UPI0039EA154C